MRLGVGQGLLHIGHVGLQVTGLDVEGRPRLARLALADPAVDPAAAAGGSFTAPLTCEDSGSLDRTGLGEAKPGNGDGRRWPCGLTGAMARDRHRGYGAGQWIISVAPGAGQLAALGRCG